MGRSVTPTHRVEVVTNVGTQTPFSWNRKDSGAPNVKNLAKWREALNASFAPKGVNAHLSDALGVVLHVSKATLIHQRSDDIVAVVNAPLFEVV